MKIDISKVRQVYSGKDGKCCCGCAGKHTYASAFREECSKSRGYPVEDEDISDRTVRMIVKKVQAQIDIGNIQYEKKDFISTVIGERLYVVYFSDAAQAERTEQAVGTDISMITLEKNIPIRLPAGDGDSYHVVQWEDESKTSGNNLATIYVVPARFLSPEQKQALADCLKEKGIQ